LRRFYIGGLLYDLALEPPLNKIKKRVAHFISRYDLYPVLDICCGSGRQCFRLERNGNGVYGLDLDIGMIHYALSKYPHIPFMCADAANIPVKDSSVRGVILSYALHDKFPETRSRILREVKRILSHDGKIVFVDFKIPWNKKSRMASFYIYGIERLAGKEHFENGRQFLKQGGLDHFIRQQELEEIERHDVDMAHTSIVVARFI
jgi:demethylmenaquinone methyltransferase/2-methoxy-6-polyprenyl-1,4-benzoquinol methylase